MSILQVLKPTPPDQQVLLKMKYTEIVWRERVLRECVNNCFNNKNENGKLYL